MNEAKEKTALCTSVGADERQSVSKNISGYWLKSLPVLVRYLQIKRMLAAKELTTAVVIYATSFIRTVCLKMWR